MTAEEARTLSRRAVFVKHVKTIDERIYNTAERGEYKLIYTNKDGYGNTKSLENSVLNEIVKHYVSEGFTVILKNTKNERVDIPNGDACTLLISWEENIATGEPAKKETNITNQKIVD
ncbi:hypothetical protein [uncultured Methanobrevibacter sp.]|uniref:hypothetical protein n=1 Tax=uncultured Methanobrevibacter sp. TaxID=253161 RepID=UPI0025D3B853|nr:hypothetical protein [uncultured Methanobrevibacter sp.]